MRQWNLKFNGSSKASAEDFLTRVDECRIFAPLLDIELVSALASWSTFRRAFRSRFGNDNFDRRVRDQIRARTQGVKEKIEDYLTCLLGLYDKLDGPYSVEEQLDNAHRGLRPEFRKTIAQP